jgi:NDP-hexose-3-ketoreductase
MKNDIINLGILGCARNIPFSVMYPLKSIANIRLVGIAGRTRDRGEEYAEKFGIPRAFACYEDLVQSGDIDMVYIMLPNSLHCEWAVKSACHAKHVLVEKPACLTSSEFAVMKKAAEDNGIELLEAVMAGHHPWQNHVRLIVDESRLGKMKEIRTSISFLPKDNFNGNYRSFPGMGGGVFYDLGSYWLQLTQKLTSVNDASCKGISRFNGPNGCDWSFEASLRTKAVVVSMFEGSFEKPYQASHEIIFESGKIVMNNVFGGNLGHHRLKLKISDHDKGTEETREFEPQNYYESQLNFFADVILGKRKNIPLSETLERIELMERIYSSAKSSGQKMK